MERDDETAHGENEPVGSEAHAQTDNAEGARVVVELPSDEGEETAELEAIRERIADIDKRVNEYVRDGDKWRTETTTSLSKEIADLKANVNQLAQGFPQQIQSMRDELTRTLQELREAARQPRQEPAGTAVAMVTVEPPAVPPEPAEPAQEAQGGTPETVPVTSASPGGTGNRSPRRGKYRVV